MKSKPTNIHSIRFQTAPKPRARGLTLVELLIVITIILILAFFSFFGISKARAAARSAVCASNLRQIGAAMLFYANDNNGQLPPLEDRTGANDGLRGIWPEFLAETNASGVPNPRGGYIPRERNRNNTLSCGAGVWACPECTVLQTNYQGYGVAEGTVMKVKRGTTPAAKGSLRLSEIPNPERTWLVGDAVKTATNLQSGWYAIWANPGSWGGQSPGARHAGKVNVCMADGHMERLTLKELREKDYTMFK